jgi:hypothetical protein
MKYRIDGREKALAFGSYPQVSLAKAREARGEAKDMLAEGKDPSVEKQREVAMMAIVRCQTFGLVAEEQLEYFERKGLAPATMRKHRVVSERSRGVAVEPRDRRDYRGRGS